MPVNKQAFYTLSGVVDGLNPADATTYYLGSTLGVPPTAAQNKTYIPRGGIISMAQVYWYAATVAGTNESFSIYVRLNNTTDYLIQAKSDTNAEKLFDNPNINIPVAVGDYIEIKLVCPTWVTNPTGVRIYWRVLVKV